MSEKKKEYTTDEINEIYLSSLIDDIKSNKDNAHMFETLSQNASILILQDRKKFFPFFESKFDSILTESAKRDDELFFEQIVLLYKLSMMIHSFPLTGVLPFKDQETGMVFNHFQELSLIGLEKVYSHMARSKLFDYSTSGSTFNATRLKMYQMLIGIEEQLSSIYLSRQYSPDRKQSTNFNKAKLYLEKALAHAQSLQTMTNVEVNDTKILELLISLYQKLGLAYKKIGDYNSVNRAIECYEKVLELMEEKQRKTTATKSSSDPGKTAQENYLTRGTTHNNLGNLCLQQLDYLLSSTNDRSEDEIDESSAESTSDQQQNTSGSAGPMILNLLDLWDASLADNEEKELFSSLPSPSMKKKRRNKLLAHIDQAILHFKQSLDLCMLQAGVKLSDLTDPESAANIQMSPSDLQQMSVILMNLGYTQCRKILFLPAPSSASKSDLVNTTITEAQNNLSQSYIILEKLMNPTDKSLVSRQVSMMRVLKGQFARLLVFLGECHMIKYRVLSVKEGGDSNSDDDARVSCLEAAAGFLERGRQYLSPEHGIWFSRITYDFASVLSKLPSQHNNTSLQEQRQEVNDLYNEAFEASKGQLNPSSADYRVLQHACSSSA